MSEEQRFCPLCERHMVAEVCPEDGVPTLVRKPKPGQRSTSITKGTIVSGRYRIDGFIGEGGMGSILLATQLSIRRPVAIKILRPEFATEAVLLKRFYREAQAVSGLNHPNIVKVIDFGVDEDSCVPYLVMEHVDGSTLRSILREGAIESERRACAILLQVAKALLLAHEMKIVHRDLKPENIIIRKLPDGDEHVKVIDFGVAKILEGVKGASMPSLTEGGEAVGTPHYMSPEQAKAERIDSRSDLYSLGCVMHDMLTGRPPFDAKQLVYVMYKQVEEPPPPLPERLRDGEVSSDDLNVLHRALLEKERERRPASTKAVVKVLSALVEGKPVGAGAALGLQERMPMEVSEKGVITSWDNDEGGQFGLGEIIGQDSEEGRRLREIKEQLTKDRMRGALWSGSEDETETVEVAEKKKE